MTYEMKILEERRDAWQQSREIALAEGREEGFERGISQGIERGANEQKILMAERMLEIGMSIPQIAYTTGLSLEEIEGLASETKSTT